MLSLQIYLSISFYSLTLTMEYKLNSYKTFKDKWILVVLWMIIAYCLMLFPLLRCSGEEVVEQEDVEIIENSEEWSPWDLNSEWNQQEMPVLLETESHKRFIELCEKYNLPADIIWHTENYYWLKEWTILCLAITETSWWTKGYGKPWCWNYWNVGNNDGWNRRCFANQWAWLAAIWQTLNNQNLKNNQTISCLNGAWECIEPNASGYRYATSKSGNWERNMIWCFYTIYQHKINPQTFNLHERN